MSYDALRRVIQNRRSEKEVSDAKYKDSSRQRLGRILEKKLNTSFIGAISKFETFFGHLWGHKKDERDCTKEQLANRKLWNQCRTEVLNNGNNQLRAVQSELLQYVIHWNRYQMNFPAYQENKGVGE